MNLRTPLAAMKSVGEVSSRGRRSEREYRETIGSLLEEVERMTTLVNGLLLLARADQKRLPVDAEAVDIHPVARDAVALLRPLAEEKGQTVVVLGADRVCAMADRLLLRQALMDILANAIKHSPQGAYIALASGRRNQVVTLEVRDTGPGIAEADRERVFDRFFKVEAGRGREEQGGCGLGLAIAKSLVEAQGGTIELDSAPGRGATFRLVLLPARA